MKRRIETLDNKMCIDRCDLEEWANREREDMDETWDYLDDRDKNPISELEYSGRRSEVEHYITLRDRARLCKIVVNNSWRPPEFIDIILKNMMLSPL